MRYLRGGLTVALSLLIASALWAAPKKVVVVGMSDADIKNFQSVSNNLLIERAEQNRMTEQVADADAIFGTITPDLLRAAKNLKWVQVYSAGVERYRFPAFIESPVTLTNCKIIQGPEIADHALALLLSLTRDLNRIIPLRASEEWRRGDYNPVELRGKTAVIVGLGGIGTQIAQRAHAFGMNVIGVDPKDIPLSANVTRVVTPQRLDTVLPEADVLFISAPHTPESEHMIGPQQFELLKRGAYFIAVSRGKLYDTDALVKALDSRRLSGAGLDVTDPEPLPKGHPLWKFENVVITPHIAGQSDGIQARRIALIKENLARFDRGEPLLNVVDKQKGF